MGKKKKNKVLKKERIKVLETTGFKTLGNVKSKCCKKFKKVNAFFFCVDLVRTVIQSTHKRVPSAGIIKPNLSEYC